MPYEVISCSANGLDDEYRYVPDYDPEEDIYQLIDERWQEYWSKYPNELRPKYYQDQWYLLGEENGDNYGIEF